MKTKWLAIPVALAIAFTPVAASAQVCGVGIIVAALIANAQQQRELTATEAATCGLMLNQDQKNVKNHKAKKRHKVARHKAAH
ncbi:MAG TPA: hypothetical protein VNQ34_08110 [Xanthobacteraceae bacterium]|jgi:hypothetical protein|nr:hypothetical protein [Xanthobacteraceae bacterium]